MAFESEFGKTDSFRTSPILGAYNFWTRTPSQSMVKLAEVFKACCGYIFSGKNTRNS
jgi:hypothetical protein